MAEGQEYAMRSRATRTSSDGGGGPRRESPSYNRKQPHVHGKCALEQTDTVFIERKLKPGDTLNKLSIQYQVNVADIKRANNLVSDVDFSALTNVKIPITRMRAALGVSSSSDDDEHIIDVDDRTRLLQDNSRSRDPSVEEIFHKTDQTIAQARTTLPENGIPGSFHFVDARPPSSSSCSIWALIGGVVLMFMIVPLLLTIYEEEQQEAVQQQHHSQQ